MSIFRQLGANSAIYTATNLLQKGAAFLLIPIYTKYLAPDAYGVLAVVTSLSGLLQVAFTLGLTSALTRFYFEYQDDPVTLAEFWGTILTFVLLLSGILGGIFFAFGDRWLGSLIGDVAFWPFVALGIATTFFMPVFSTLLTVLQTRNQAGRYAALSLAHFVFLTALTVFLVIVLRKGAVGALAASLVAAAVFFVFSLWLLRHEFRFCLKWRHLRQALAYGLPQVPHMLASQITATADRLVLNSRLGATAAGLYSLGAMVSMVIEVVAQSVNRAYVPLSMRALKVGTGAEVAQLNAVGTLIVAFFCLLGVAAAAFGKEIVLLLANESYANAAIVVPVLSFAGVASAHYYLFVSILFFERRATKLIPLGTLTACGLNLVLMLVLVPRFQLIGAAWAALCAQCAAALLVGVIGARFDPVPWSYVRFAVAFATSMTIGLFLADFSTGSTSVTILVKFASIVAFGMALSTLFWRRPLILGQAILHLSRRRVDAASALFYGGAS